MSPLNEHTRKLINDLDEKLNELKEDLEDNYDLDNDNNLLDQTREDLDYLMHRMTQIQEAQGWLD